MRTEKNALIPFSMVKMRRPSKGCGTSDVGARIVCRLVHTHRAYCLAQLGPMNELPIGVSSATLHRQRICSRDLSPACFQAQIDLRLGASRPAFPTTNT